MRVSFFLHPLKVLFFKSGRIASQSRPWGPFSCVRRPAAVIFSKTINKIKCELCLTLQCAICDEVWKVPRNSKIGFLLEDGVASWVKEGSTPQSECSNFSDTKMKNLISQKFAILRGSLGNPRCCGP